MFDAFLKSPSIMKEAYIVNTLIFVVVLLVFELASESFRRRYRVPVVVLCLVLGIITVTGIVR